MRSPYLHLLARILVALIFVLSGVSKIFNFAGTAAFMASVGFPAPQLFLVAAIILELGGGLGLLLGFKARWSTIALIVFLLAATLTIHVPGLGDPAHRQEQLIQVLKNLAILGGLILFYLEGPGPYTLKAD